jgi:hypothetical protein
LRVWSVWPKEVSALYSCERHTHFGQRYRMRLMPRIEPASAKATMHLTDAAIGAALDPSGDQAGTAARAHAASCANCGDAVESARAADREVADMLRALDHPPPAADFAVIEQRAAQAVTAPHETPRIGGGLNARGGQRGRPDAGAARGALGVVVRRGIFFLLAASVAAAAVAPRSPVRHLMTAWLTIPRETQPNLPAGPPAATPPRAATPRGIAIIAQHYAVVTFRLPQAHGEIRVVTTAAQDPRGPRVSVLASADGVTYMVAPDTISIDNRAVASLDYDVELPPLTQLRVVSIRVGGRVVFARNGSTIETTGTKQSGGTYVIPLSAEASPVLARKRGI